jgi:hypothetical protein
MPPGRQMGTRAELWRTGELRQPGGQVDHLGRAAVDWSVTIPGNKKRPSARGGAVLLILFSLPFAGGGTLVGYLAGSMVLSWARAQSWEEVPARILAADLESHRGDDSITYEVTAVYEYSVMGQTYTSDAVSFGLGSDNIGSFHQDAYRELRGYVGTGRSFRCFVDPDDPSQAMLYRDMRWGLLGLEVIFALVFAGVGYGLMFAAIWGGRAVAAEGRLREAQPEQPWMWKKEWADGRVPSGAKGTVIGRFIFATLWNLISAPALFFVPAEVAGGNRMALVALIFPIIGVLLAAWAVHALLQWKKFGGSVFEMHACPGVLGGYLEGRIDTGIRWTIDDDIELTLRCVRRETSGSGKNRSTTERVLWHDSALVPGGSLVAGPNGASIPVRFAIPYDAGPASDADASSPILWKLEAEAEMPGVDFAASFDVPVFITGDSDPEFEAEPTEAPAIAEHDAAAG